MNDNVDMRERVRLAVIGQDGHRAGWMDPEDIDEMVDDVVALFVRECGECLALAEKLEQGEA